tara:strand:- start:29 stop:415 length:387 start_codon:yes stop_codon:yes gene_type:complete
MASILRVNTLTDASSNNSVPMATVASGSAKAWLNYNQATPASVDSFSISSVTDSTTGQYKINVSSAFANTGYSCTGLAKGEAGTSLGRISEDHDNSRTTSQMPIITSRISDGAYRDLVSSDSIHGDLA